MKKYIIVISFICILLLTGCGSKSLNDKVGEKILSCTKDISSNDISMIQTADIKFVDNKIDGITTSILVTLPESYKANINTFMTSFNETYKNQYAGNNHVKITTNKKSDNEILVDIIFDYKNMNNEEKASTGFVGSEDYDVNKASLQKLGYTCK